MRFLETVNSKSESEFFEFNVGFDVGENVKILVFSEISVEFNISCATGSKPVGLIILRNFDGVFVSNF